MIDLSQLAAYVAPALVVSATAWRLMAYGLGRFEKKLDQNKAEMLTELKGIKLSMADSKQRLYSLEQRQAWLEGKAGTPLGGSPPLQPHDP